MPHTKCIWKLIDIIPESFCILKGPHNFSLLAILWMCLLHVVYFKNNWNQLKSYHHLKPGPMIFCDCWHVFVLPLLCKIQLHLSYWQTLYSIAHQCNKQIYVPKSVHAHMWVYWCLYAYMNHSKSGVYMRWCYLLPVTCIESLWYIIIQFYFAKFKYKKYSHS